MRAEQVECRMDLIFQRLLSWLLHSWWRRLYLTNLSSMETVIYSTLRKKIWQAQKKYSDWPKKHWNVYSRSEIANCIIINSIICPMHWSIEKWLSRILFYSLHYWRPQVGGYWSLCQPGPCGGVQQQSMGNSVWWSLGNSGCKCGLQTTGLLSKWLEFEILLLFLVLLLLYVCFIVILNPSQQ